jgi:hypothetical protein
MSFRSTTDTDEKDLEDEKDSPMKDLTSLLKDNAIFRFFTRYTEDQYRPEKHYMRGPGPKAKAKEGDASTTSKAYCENTTGIPHRQ